MSEEQPVFKVTDRRLFNPDGTPRDIPREEEEPKPAAAAEAAPAAEPAGETQTEAPPPPDEIAEEAAPAEQLSEEEYAEGEIPGADDPASFINFLMSIASNAAAALGMMKHPVTQEVSVDPELAKHWIDVLGMLRQKTRGNLAPQEEQIFEGLLADLRMQYVSLTGARRPQAPRGFSGRDITGGK